MRQLIFSVLVMATICAVKIAAQTPQPSPPPYQSLRFEEDYSYLKDKARRTESLDKLKYIPLGKENWYLSLGGEARFRYETYRNAAFGAGVQDRNGYFLGRFLLHADWHLGKNFRVFTQLQSGFQINRNGGSRPTDKDLLDVHQAFFDYKIFSGEKRSLTIRAGRQEIEIGAGRLVSVSEGLNVRRSFDAIRATYTQGKWRASGLFAKLVATNGGFFDDAPLNQQTFWGAGLVRARPEAKGGFSFSYLGLDRKSARFNQGTGREIRQTFVGRIWGGFKKFDYNYELIRQTGTFGAGRIRAWAMATETGFALSSKTRIALRANATSGDRNPLDKNLQSFNPLFPGTAYSGAIALVGPTNIFDLSPTVQFNLTKKTTLIVDSAFYWRQNLNDGLYGINVNLQRISNLSRARFVGGLPSARFDYRINRHWTWTARYSHFFVGRFLRETPPAEAVDYFTTWTTFRF